MAPDTEIDHLLLDKIIKIIKIINYDAFGDLIYDK